MSEKKDKKQGKRQYFERFIYLFPRKTSWVFYSFLIITLWFSLSGFGIIFDSIYGTFPTNLNTLRELFIFSWFMCVLFFVFSIFLSKRFYSNILSWIESQEFVAKGDPKNRLEKSFDRFLSFGFGPFPLIMIVVVYFLRRVLMTQFFNAPVQIFGFLTDPVTEVEIYEYWFIGTDFLTTIVALTFFWTIILFSSIIHYVGGKYPLKIQDLAEYKDKYRDIVVLANRNMIFTGIGLAVYLSGIIFWALKGSAIEYYLATFSIVLVSTIGVALICWLNLSGIHRGLEKSKKAKIADIRSTSLSSDLIDLQISLHSQLSFWKIGPRVIDSLLLPIVVAEIPILIDNIDVLRKLFGF